MGPRVLLSSRVAIGRAGMFPLTAIELPQGGRPSTAPALSRPDFAESPHQEDPSLDLLILTSYCFPAPSMECTACRTPDWPFRAGPGWRAVSPFQVWSADIRVAMTNAAVVAKQGSSPYQEQRRHFDPLQVKVHDIPMPPLPLSNLFWARRRCPLRPGYAADASGELGGWGGQQAGQQTMGHHDMWLTS